MKKLVLIVTGGLMMFQAKSQTLKQAVANTDNELFETSAQVFYKLLASKPNDPELLFYMGENFYASERLDSAAVYYDRGILSDPTNALNYVGKGKIALSKGNLAEAKALFAKAREISANKKADVLLEIAEAYTVNEAVAKDMAPALEVLGLAEKLDANNLNLYLLLGDAVLFGENDGSKALNSYEKAASIDAKSPKPNVHMGALYERGRAYDLALNEYNKAIEKDSTFAPSYRQLGDLYYKFNDYQKAQSSYEKYLKLAGNSFSAKVKYAKFLFLAKKYKEAIDEIREIQLTDNSLNVLNRLLGYSMYETKQYAEGLLYLEKFLANAAAGNNTIIAQDYYYHGKLLSAQGKDSLAIPEYQKSLQMDSMSMDTYNGLADSYMKRGDFDNSIATVVKKIAHMKEPGINDYFRLGQTYFNKAGTMKDSISYQKADSIFVIVTEKKPEEMLGHLFRAKANAGLDPETKLGLAKPFYEKVIEMAAADPVKNKRNLIEANYYLAYFYYTAKDKPNALIYVDKVLAIDPAFEQAVNLKKLIEKYLK